MKFCRMAETITIAPAGTAGPNATAEAAEDYASETPVAPPIRARTEAFPPIFPAAVQPWKNYRSDSMAACWFRDTDSSQDQQRPSSRPPDHAASRCKDAGNSCTYSRKRDACYARHERHPTHTLR